MAEDGTVAAAGTLSPRKGGGGVGARAPSPPWRQRRHHYPWRAALRRAIDAAGAALLLALLGPALLAVALLLRAAGGGGGVRGGAVLAQRRVVGRGGREFMLLTFRAEPATVLGQLLDASGVAALPMLLNVLRGEMALVGPAPLTRTELAALRLNPASLRRPGMIVQGT